jgi:hypothetical protein
MNWTRGLFRLWLLAGLAWSLCVVSVQWQEAAEDCSTARHYASLLPHQRCSQFQAVMGVPCGRDRPSDLTPEAEAKALADQKVAAGQQCRMAVQSAAEDIAALLALFIGVSVALYIIGAALIWALRGFRQKEPQA